MKLLRLKVDGFGALKGEFAFDPGRVTLLVDDNERGKSTLLAAIAAALYGLEDNKRTHRVLTPLDRWRPWPLPGGAGGRGRPRAPHHHPRLRARHGGRMERPWAGGHRRIQGGQGP